MTDELDLLRRHIAAIADRPPDVDEIRRRLHEAIAVEATAADHGGTTNAQRTPTAGRSRHRLFAVGGLVAAAAVAVVVVASVVTSNTPMVRRGPLADGHRHTTLSPGDQLRLIADRVAEQPVPQLRSDQLLLTQSDMAVGATVNDGQAEATIELTVKKWSNVAGQSCTSITARPAQFANPAEQSAWSGLGLLDLPNTQPVTGCLGGGVLNGAPDTITGDGSVLDVSTLPTDPAVLAQELENGTTGLTGVDHLPVDSANPNIAFQRAAVLLVGPTVGATTQFNAALLQAIALLPGVTGLGPTTAHDGSTGQGFATAAQNGQSSIVVDPTTGRLLEVGNIEDASALSSVAYHYLGPGLPQVTSYSAQLLWLDPVGEPTVVSASDVPVDVPLAIFATAKSGVAESQIFALRQQLAQQFGEATGGGSFALADPTVPGSQTTVQFEFAGAGQQFSDYLEAVKGSGLFTSVNVV